MLVVTLVGIIMMFFKRKKPQAFNHYLIKKGRHFSIKNSFPWPYKIAICKDHITFIGVFSKGCDYVNNDPERDINKLYGISYGFDNQYRSVRIGWRYNDNLKVVEIFSYSHVKGKKIFDYICSVKLYEEIRFKVARSTKTAVLVTVVANEELLGSRLVSGIDKSYINFKEFPYFGGNYKAPNNMNFYIKEI